MFDEIFRIIVVLLSLIFFIRLSISAIKTLWRRIKLHKKGSKVSGKIVRIDKRQQSLLARYGETPVFEFTTQEGNKITGQAINSFYSYPISYKLNQIHSIYYDPQQPDIFVVKKWSEDVLLAFGGIFLISVSAGMFFLFFKIIL